MAQRKTKGDRKAITIRLRVTADQKRTLVAAAKQAGLELSGWLRLVGLREARRIEADETA